MPPVLLCLLVVSEVGVSGSAVEVEPFCSYFITLCGHLDGSRGASLTKWCVTWKYL